MSLETFPPKKKLELAIKVSRDDKYGLNSLESSYISFTLFIFLVLKLENISVLNFLLSFL